MKATKPWTEETREIWGLVILLVVLLINWMWLRRIGNKKINLRGT